jgi:sugar O-acyltransferase (sialic acid O-acetyltransferase NeuD family)
VAAVRSAGEAVPIVGLGAGSHAKSVLEAIRSAGRFEVAALVDDDPARAGGEVLGFPIVGPDALERLGADGVTHAFAGVGGVGSSSARRRVFERLLAAEFELPAIVHAAAIVSPWARLGRGAQVLAGAVVNAGAEIGDGVIVNTGAIVEHDCRLGAHAHIAPGARLAGLVTVGEGAHVGLGAIVIEGVQIGAAALVAAGGVVIRDVPDGGRVAGVPARPLA